jgi:KDO2-lipid IV(A) lauroyltransferase
MLNYVLYRIGQFIALSLPLKIGYGVAIVFSDVHYIFARQARRDVKGNLKAIFPEKSNREIRKIRIRMFRNFAKYLVDFFRFEKLDSEYVKKNIFIENRQYSEQALAKGKGVIVLSAHIGNWELGGAAVSLSGYPLWVVVLPHKNKKVNAFFDYQRKSKGINVVPLGMAVRRCFEILKGNNMLALVGDRDFNENGIVINFFGKSAIFPEGPAAFSLKTGAVILPVFMVRNEDDSFTLKIEKPIEFTPSQNKEKDITELIKHYKVIIEDYIRKYPDQWYMFRRFWI